MEVQARDGLLGAAAQADERQRLGGPPPCLPFADCGRRRRRTSRRARRSRGRSSIRRGAVAAWPSRCLDDAPDARVRPSIRAPSSRTLPPVGRSSPTISLRSVLFPAPFGPTTATMSPSSIPNVTPLTAGRPPKRFVTRQLRGAGSGLHDYDGGRYGGQRRRLEYHSRPEGGRGGVQPALGRCALGQDGVLRSRPDHLSPRRPPERPRVAGDVEGVRVDIGGDPLAVDSDLADRLRDDLHVGIARQRVVLEELVLRERPQVALRKGLVLLARRRHALEVAVAAERRRGSVLRSERPRPVRTHHRRLQAQLLLPERGPAALPADGPSPR